MSQHPINRLMQTALENMKEMIDGNTVVGDPVQTSNGIMIIPISKVGLGFAAGGSEFNSAQTRSSLSDDVSSFPFGGGSGGGLTLTPIAFLVVDGNEVKVISVETQTHLVERLLEEAPQWLDKIKGVFSRNKEAKAKDENAE